MSLLLRSKISGLFVSRLTVDDRYSHNCRENLAQPMEMQISKNKSIFSECFIAFLKCPYNFKNFEKKMSLIAWVFPMFLTPKDAFT